MAKVTLQLLEGLERGLMFRDLPTPVTIGREDDNTVRLNDERVSRFHAKIQEDGGQIILTDLESTNGTRINGHPIQMRVLQIGDQIAIGRCLLLFGSPEEITAKVEAMLNSGEASAETSSHTEYGAEPFEGQTCFADGQAGAGSFHESDDEQPNELFPDGAPETPRGLRPLQRAQVSDLLGYCHEQIRRVLQTATEETGNGPAMRVGWHEWQRLLRLEMELAASMKKVADPDA
jgi:pSer/pThr/pTyr-binding forkhead associated (FHA) protein